MHQGIRNVLLVSKPGDESAKAVLAEVQKVLSGLGVACEVMVNPMDSGDGDAAWSLPQGQAGPDLAVVLGGDGTMISAARKLRATRAPLLGINLGRVGFLAQLSGHDWAGHLERMVRQGFQVSELMMLDCRVFRGGGQVFEGKAVNDVVISRGAMARLVRLHLAYGGARIGSFRVDGLIISTPAGSTAYNMSAGGPLVHPDLSLMTVAPVCPFLCNLPPLVLPTDREVEVCTEGFSADVILTCDGQTVFPLKSGDQVRVGKSADSLRLVADGGQGYFVKLADKGFVREL